MFDNFIEETCTGTGITLALAGAAPDRIPFNKSFSDGDSVSYVIEDSGGTIIVAGVGTYVSATDDITRNDTWNWNGTVVDNNPSTNITLSGGAHTIICDVISNQIAPVPLGLGVADRVQSAHYHYFVGSTGNSSIGANTQYAMPFKLEAPLLVSAMGAALTTGVDGSTTRLGFSKMIDGLPIDMIFDVAIATTTTQSSTFTSASVTPRLLRPGWYFFHLVSTAAIIPTAVSGGGAADWTPLKKMNTGIRSGPSANYTKSGVTGGTLDAPETVTAVTTGFHLCALSLVK